MRLQLTLLGSPLGDVENVSVALRKKTDSLAVMSERLDLLRTATSLRRCSKKRTPQAKLSESSPEGGAGLPSGQKTIP